MGCEKEGVLSNTNYVLGGGGEKKGLEQHQCVRVGENEVGKADVSSFSPWCDLPVLESTFF